MINKEHDDTKEMQVNLLPHAIEKHIQSIRTSQKLYVAKIFAVLVFWKFIVWKIFGTNLKYLGTRDGYCRYKKASYFSKKNLCIYMVLLHFISENFSCHGSLDSIRQTRLLSCWSDQAVILLIRPGSYPVDQTRLLSCWSDQAVILLIRPGCYSVDQTRLLSC